ncbi:hypothetical protein HPB47_020284 [Ixodes persulcatus]|uniref:Uncharacterized protein n=1 Tax=Ixodes persulcatus TaxID=34615 RepID=A0AC60QHT9_IXOPE|nr:hypothetical protein HPB47_020284 [Ixodes persulcatus]
MQLELIDLQCLPALKTIHREPQQHEFYNNVDKSKYENLEEVGEGGSRQALATATAWEKLTLLSRQFRISHSAVNGFLADICDAIYRMIGPKVLVSPRTKDKWLAVMNNFQARWQLPQCIGALDGKHVVITKPPNSGSNYFVLFALVDADSRFLYIDVGAPGSGEDGGIRRTTPLRNAIEKGKAGLPISRPGSVGVPPVIVGDDAFRLVLNLMKPYPGTKLDAEQKIFNYRYVC